MRLNRPGLPDGLYEVFLDGEQRVSASNLDLRGTFADYGLNGVMMHGYWEGGGSPIDQSRWVDDFVIATAPIGCGAP